MIGSLLIANRGEIAVRVMRTARRLGLRTVAVYSEADETALHVRLADEAVAIGPAPVRESYLVAERIIAAAKATGAEAVHPGYGFLSENAAFAEAVIAAGLVWVGPPPEAIRAMGLKDAAKALMTRAGVPVTPGYLGEDQSPERLQREADAIGYPVLIKAVAGGGGKGMRRVGHALAFQDALAACRREAASSFGDDRVLLETYVSRPRHIEVQVFADDFGDAVHLYERDCSLQRRHQKVIEEAPAPGMDAATRAAVCGAAVKAALAVGYRGAGTVEFIADASEGLRADRIWFMEMNTRLQVEHPVTEAITGLDLVEWQLRVACGEPLPLKQEDIGCQGWAMEARLYAEDPNADFQPSIGPLKRFALPHDLARIDTGVEEGGQIGPFYDPMIAKLIVHRPSRAAAAALAEACRAVQVWPVKTNAAFLARALADPQFVAGDVDTDLLSRHLESLSSPRTPPAAVFEAAAAALFAAERSRPSPEGPWDALVGFRSNAPARISVGVQIEDQIQWIDLNASSIPASGADARSIEGVVVVFADGEAYLCTAPQGHGIEDGGSDSDGVIRSPMPGLIVSTPVAEGDRVAKNQPLMVLEAMKMEHTLAAPFDAVVAAVSATLGQQVAEGAVLVRLVKEGRS